MSRNLRTCPERIQQIGKSFEKIPNHPGQSNKITKTYENQENHENSQNLTNIQKTQNMLEK